MSGSGQSCAKGTESGGVTNRLLEQYGYGFDAAGNLNQRTNNDLVQTFNVNSLNELSNVTRNSTMTVAGTSTSQATGVTVNGANAVLYGDYTFAAAGQSLVDGTNTFTAIAHDSLGRWSTNVSICYLPTNAVFGYDANGNLTSDGERNFAYDDENELTSVWVTNNWRSDFTYDGKMSRRIRFESAWSGSTWITNTIVRYVYDGNLVIEERDANNLPLVIYTRGKDFSGSLEGAGGIGGLLARTDYPSTLIPQPSTGPAHAYYHADGNGNIICLVNSKQATVAKYLYDPFGSILSQSGPLADANLYRFSSKECHVNSGMYYYLYRFYDPNLQRWINSDPMGEIGFELMHSPMMNEYSDGQHLYTFALNDPLDEVDYLGLQGGPYHPPPGVSLSCDASDSCGRLSAKMTLLMRMIASHTGWDQTMPPPRGGGRHADEIAGLWRAYANCQAIHAAKNCQNPSPPKCWERVIMKVPGSDEAWRMVAVGGAVVAILAGGGALIFGTGGAAIPVLAPAFAP